MPIKFDLELVLAYYLSIFGPFILLFILAICILPCIFRRLYRYYSTPSSVRAEEHRRWEMGRVKEWIRVRREVVDRGWESLGCALEEEGETGREERYKVDERLRELEGRLRELEEEERGGVVGDLEGGRRVD